MTGQQLNLLQLDAAATRQAEEAVGGGGNSCIDVGLVSGGGLKDKL